MRRRLAGVDAEAASAAAWAVAQRAMADRAVGAASTLLICLAFGDELDTRPLIDRLTDAGKRVCLPRCVEGRRELTVHPYPCALERLSFGLEQPTRDSPAIDAATLDLALLVGLAFDHKAYRLGHGGGYFDRFLAATALPAIGLAYDQQIVEELPRLAHDVPLTAVLTPTRTLRPAPDAA